MLLLPLLLPLLLLLSAPLHAQTFGIDQLMQLLAAMPESEVRYYETRESNLLSQPVLSAGTLSFRRPDTVEKTMLEPRRETYRIVGQELIVIRGRGGQDGKGSERRIALSSQPMLAAFAASLRGVLLGDAALLRRHYRIELQGEQNAWRLTLTPTAADMQRYVERITVAGREGSIAEIEVRERNGDSSLMRIQAR